MNGFGLLLTVCLLDIKLFFRSDESEILRSVLEMSAESNDSHLLTTETLQEPTSCTVELTETRNDGSEVIFGHEF